MTVPADNVNVPTPFEDPRKTELRSRCAAALDASGHDLVEPPEPMPLPTGLGLRGHLRGDLETRDVEGTRYHYFVRMATDKPVPQWIINFARAAQQMEMVRIFIIVEKRASALEKSCRAAGVGLLHIHDDLKLDLIVDPAAIDRDSRLANLASEVRTQRRALENKLHLYLEEVQNNYSQARHLTADMVPDTRDKYIASIEKAGMHARDWAGRLSEKLDEISTSGDEESLRQVADEIERGLQT